MLIPLPAHSTVIACADSNHLTQQATWLIRGHVAKEKRANVLIIGDDPILDSEYQTYESKIVYAESGIDAVRYSLIVVNSHTLSRAANQWLIEAESHNYQTLLTLFGLNIPVLILQQQ